MFTQTMWGCILHAPSTMSSNLLCHRLKIRASKPTISSSWACLSKDPGHSLALPSVRPVTFLHIQRVRGAALRSEPLPVCYCTPRMKAGVSCSGLIDTSGISTQPVVLFDEMMRQNVYDVMRHDVTVTTRLPTDPIPELQPVVAGEGHHITFTFQMPSLMEEYGKKVEDYWGHLLGHEGPGSLLSALKAKQWATGLSAGAWNTNTCSLSPVTDHQACRSVHA